MYFIFTILLALVDLSFAGCHSKSVDFSKPMLGIKTEGFSGAQHDANDNDVFEAIYARIYTNAWSPWRLLDTTDCDDFSRGETDYFDDFKSYTAPWKGVALYGCGNDGLAVDVIWYWTGTEISYKSYFCGDVCGPSATSANFGGTGPGYCGARNGPYDYVWLDNDQGRLPGMVVKTTGSSNLGIAFDYPAGTPFCGINNEYGALANPEKRRGSSLLLNSVDDSTNELFNGMMILAAVIMILTCAMCVLISMMVKKNKNKRYYQEVDVVSS